MVAASFTIDKSKPVLVTGATGYVAGVLIQQLLKEGVTVHATCRDPSKKEKIEYLSKLAVHNPGSIRFYAADLMKPDSFEEGMKGCSIVFHCASPFQIDVKDAQKDLIEPAVHGTENVLLQANKTPSVKRVVLTSSCAAIYTDASETVSGVNEETWNRTATIDYQPYSLSKTLAEQKAWTIAGSQTQWKLVVINPGLVLGPGATYHPSSTSFDIMKQLGDGTMAYGCADLGMGLVDVREVAQAHIAAAYKEGASGRHILCGHNSSFFGIAEALQPKFGSDYPIPTGKIPKLVLMALAPTPLLPLSFRTVWNTVSVTPNFDNTKSKNELGIVYRPLEETAGDMFQQMIDKGVFAAKEEDKKED